MALSLKPIEETQSSGSSNFCQDKMSGELFQKFKNISLSNTSSFYEKKQTDGKGKNLYLILQENKSQIKLQDLQFIVELGKGAFGSVDKVRWKEDGTQYALKKIILIDEKQFENRLSHELRALMSCDSPYVVKCYGVIYSQGIVNIIMEYMNGGTLEVIQDKLNEEQDQFNLLPLTYVILQVLRGLTYLNQELKIIHRDIKPANILLNKEGDVKIADLGICTFIDNSMQFMNSFVGTAVYMSPERINGNEYLANTDVWSVGMSIIELVLGCHPLKTCTSFWDIVVLLLEFKIPTEVYTKLEQDEKEQKIGQFLIELIQKCLQKDFKSRKSAEDLVKLPFFEKVSQMQQETFAGWLQNLLDEDA